MSRPAVKVLIVEDSLVVQEFLVQILSEDPELQVVGTARNGEEAIEFLERALPDVITMDIHMPKMDGLEATRRIMQTRPVPIVIVSGSRDPREVATTFEAIQAGAVAVLPRPKGIGHAEHEATARELVQMVKLMSEVKVIRRWPQARKDAAASEPSEAGGEKPRGRIQIVAIGGSTGAPVVFQSILARLPKDLPVPILIVQHMAVGFVNGFAEWLAQSSGFPVSVASQGEPLVAGRAYVAPDDFHLGVQAPGRIVLSQAAPEHGMRPSVSFLFRSVLESYGPNAVGVLLTGMGKDGAEELKRMKDGGAFTIAQDRESSVVDGMPGEAKKLDAAMYVLSPERIAVALASLANENNRAPRII